MVMYTKCDFNVMYDIGSWTFYQCVLLKRIWHEYKCEKKYLYIDMFIKIKYRSILPSKKNHIIIYFRTITANFAMGFK